VRRACLPILDLRLDPLCTVLMVLGCRLRCVTTVVMRAAGDCPHGVVGPVIGSVPEPTCNDNDDHCETSSKQLATDGLRQGGSRGYVCTGGEGNGVRMTRKTEHQFGATAGPGVAHTGLVPVVVRRSRS
jgi:hypothetical protein